MNISGTSVVITGASSGVGAAIARAMASAGAAQLVLLARNAAALQQLAAELAPTNTQVHCYPCDLADQTQVMFVSRQILLEVGTPDILINNAGSGKWKFLDNTSFTEIQQIMTLPYFAAAWLTQIFLPAMRVNGHGHIVNISSVASRLVWPGATAYIAACRAMRGLSDALQADTHGSGVCVTHYESGPIDTPYWQNNPNSRERVPGIARLLVPMLTAEQVAVAIVKGIRNNRRLIVIPGMMRVVYGLNRIFPWAVKWLMINTGYRYKS